MAFCDDQQGFDKMPFVAAHVKQNADDTVEFVVESAKKDL
jgi:hypothetical protein